MNNFDTETLQLIQDRSESGFEVGAKIKPLLEGKDKMTCLIALSACAAFLESGEDEDLHADLTFEILLSLISTERGPASERCSKPS